MKKSKKDEVLNYVRTVANKVRHKAHREDVVQDVMIVLIGKGLYEAKLDDGLKNYIKGIVWNISTTFFNKMKNANMTFTGDFSTVNYVYVEEEEENDPENLAAMYTMIKKYVFENYYLKGRSVVRWKVFYLRLKGYDYPFIKERLGITYYTSLEYYSKSCIELKEKLKVAVDC